MAQMARDLDLDSNLVSRWKKEAQAHGAQAFPGADHLQDEELAQLRSEVERARSPT